jgi:TolB-like protein/ketosteroid isomerase-like protein
VAAVAATLAAVIVVYALIKLIPVGGPLKVAVMEFEAQQLSPEDAWIAGQTRDSLNAILCNVGATELNVDSAEKIAFKCKTLEKIECAEKLGIHKMISGKISANQSRVFLEVRVVDVEHGGSLEHSFPHEGPKKDLIELQNEAAEDLLNAFQIKLTPEKRHLLFASRTKGTAESYRDFYDSLPVAEGEPLSFRPRAPQGLDVLAWGITAAYAEDEKADILALLQQYSEALEAKSVDRCAALQVDMDERQRDSLRRYFDNAKNLHVQISKVDIAVEGNDAVATFTRRDEFTEAPTGRDVQLEVRLSGLLTKQHGHWKIRGLRKPS